MALIQFQDSPSTDTPINSANLNHNFNEVKNSNTYGTSQSNGYSQEYINKLVKGTVLYDNSTGTTSNITLSDSSANYDYIEVFYGYNASSGIFMSSIKVYQPDGKLIGPIMAVTSPTNDFIIMARLNFSASSLNFIANNEVAITSSGSVSFDSNRQISIFRVVGYK